jgi:predicted phage terminase large subunit-like protein
VGSIRVLDAFPSPPVRLRFNNLQFLTFTVTAEVAAPDDPVFPSSSGRPDGAMLEKLKSVARRGRLNCGHCITSHKLEDGTVKVNRCADDPFCSRWFLHKFRHTYATRHLQDGIDIRTLQQWMGHRDFEGQYQQSPAPPGGGMVRQDWFRRYAAPPAKFDSIFQSWDTANKMSELNDFSVCTTWGVVGKNLYLLNVLRKRLEYPDLKRAVCSQAQAFSAVTVLIEDKASGTQLIQELKREDLCNVRGYNSTLDKQMRLVSVTSTIENGFVYLPEKAAWLDDYLHEMILFPRGNFDDQVDSTSQALLWIRENRHPYGLLAWYEALASKTAVSEMQERLFTRRYI